MFILFPILEQFLGLDISYSSTLKISAVGVVKLALGANSNLSSSKQCTETSFAAQQSDTQVNCNELVTKRLEGNVTPQLLGRMNTESLMGLLLKVRELCDRIKIPTASIERDEDHFE